MLILLLPWSWSNHLRNLPSTYYFLAKMCSVVPFTPDRNPFWSWTKIFRIGRVSTLGIRVISAENHDRGPSWVSMRIFVNSVTTTAIIDNPIQHGSPLAVTFLDLQNAFGSVAHGLITDILTHIKLPDSLITYISNGYSKVTVSVKTKNWRTPVFEIKGGMLQGDTLVSSDFPHCVQPSNWA